MFCTQCGTAVPETAKFCPRCGAPLSRPADAAPAPAPTAPAPPQGPPAAPPYYAPAPAAPAAPPYAPPPAYPPLHPGLAQGLALQPGEAVVQVWRAGLTQTYRNMDDEDRPYQLNGVLVATDRRLCFVEEKGLMGKSYRLKESIPLEQVTGYSVGKLFRMKGLSLTVNEGGRSRRVELGNVYEVEPAGLQALPPAPVEHMKATLERLFRRGP